MERMWVLLLTGLLGLGLATAISPLKEDTKGYDVPEDGDNLMWDLLPAFRSDRQPRASNGQTEFSAAEVKKILAKHNELRAAVSPRASNMKYMVWDANLATMAQRWADRCRFEHGQTSNLSPYDPVGQNVFAKEGTRDRILTASDFVEFWHAEVSGYHYNSNSCVGRECGHYTQVVWADSREVGCGAKFCPRIGSKTNGWFIVCNYGPAGNFQGEVPYQTGEPCSKCAADTPYCYRGLCHSCNPRSNSECTCTKRCKNCGTLNSARCTCDCPNGFTGADCGEVCRDTHQYCNQNPGWPDESFCSFDPMVPVGCPLMCGLCRPQDRNYYCANPNGSGGGGSRPSSGGGGGVTKPKKKKKKKGRKGKKGKKGKGKKKKKNGRRPRSLLDQLPW